MKRAQVTNQFYFQIKDIEQYALHAFADALESVPLALAENSGLDPIKQLAAVRACQMNESNPRLGVDCKQVGTNGEWVLLDVGSTWQLCVAWNISLEENTLNFMNNPFDSRYESPKCNRDPDWKEAADSSRHPARQYDPQDWRRQVAGRVLIILFNTYFTYVW